MNQRFAYVYSVGDFCNVYLFSFVLTLGAFGSILYLTTISNTASFSRLL